MTIITGSRNHGKTIAQASGCQYNPDVDPVISHSKGDKLLGGVIYKSHTGASINMHAAGFHKHWLNRDFLWVLFNYPFEQLGCSKVFVTIHSDRPELLEFVKKIGFKKETVIKDVFSVGTGGTDMIVLGMYREDCRWLKPRVLTQRSKSGRVLENV